MRYARQTILAEVSDSGQTALNRARVLIVGVGGLGSPVALYLAAAGIGQLGLVDADHVSLTNLARQILFQTSDLGSLKTDVAKARLEDMNPDCRVVVYPEFLTPENAAAIAGDYDVIVDATDNFETKYLLNDLSVKLDKPLVYGSILRWQGQASVFWASHGPCYRCLFPDIPKAHVPNCAEAGVIGALAGTIGSLQALEVIKLVLMKEGRFSREETLIGRLHVFDAKTFATRTITLAKDPVCDVCSKASHDISLPIYDLSRICVVPDKSFEQKWKEYRFLDVRELNEWERGHIPGALHWPLSTLRAGSFPVQAQNETTVVYCQSGVRSLTAIHLLENAGWDLSSVQDLPGGFGAWAGPVEQGM